MRKSLWVILVVCGFATYAILAPGTLRAGTITTYDINFTTTSGSPAPTSGSFTYDSTTPSFTNFTVSWNGITFDLTASANAPTLNVRTGCTGESTTSAYGFLLISEGLTGCTPTYYWNALSDNQLSIFSFQAQTNAPSINLDSIDASGQCPLCTSQHIFALGGWAISPLSTPEPGSLMLTLTGVGLLGLTLVLRKRKAHDLAQTT